MPQGTTEHMETEEREPLPLQCSLTFLRCLKAQLNIWKQQPPERKGTANEGEDAARTTPAGEHRAATYSPQTRDGPDAPPPTPRCLFQGRVRPGVWPQDPRCYLPAEGGGAPGPLGRDPGSPCPRVPTSLWLHVRPRPYGRRPPAPRLPALSVAPPLLPQCLLAPHGPSTLPLGPRLFLSFLGPPRPTVALSLDPMPCSPRWVLSVDTWPSPAHPALFINTVLLRHPLPFPPLLTVSMGTRPSPPPWGPWYKLCPSDTLGPFRLPSALSFMTLRFGQSRLARPAVGCFRRPLAPWSGLYDSDNLG
ncbi:WAS/WASL-interacting protein family member 3-like [Equus caballus]|uniref:WAS/WASL-interacting protein family member 3-like n=1 Tax=Equus caballus TaxID=9796 RepID=UPI0038B3CBEB